MRLVSTLLLGLLIVLIAVGLGSAVTEHDYHYIELSGSIQQRWPICVDVTSKSDNLFGWTSGCIDYWNGSIWTRIKNFGASYTCPRCIFVDSSGNLYIAATNVDSLIRGVRSTGMTFSSWDRVLGFDCTTTGSLTPWRLCEAGAGTLYAGIYTIGGAMDDTCAVIYRSVDTGANWTRSWPSIQAAQRHVHGVWYDSNNEKVYAAVGDLSPNRRLMSKFHNGAWTVISTDDGGLSQATAFAPSKWARFWGTDGTAENYVAYTTDDSLFTHDLDLTDGRNCHVWDMAEDPEGVIFAGTFSQGSPKDSAALYYRPAWNDTAWYVAYDCGTRPQWKGVRRITGWDSEGYGYFYDDNSSGSNYDFIYKFRNAPVYTVGSGGDFATIDAALADPAVGCADTLVLLAGSHNVSSENLYHNMTIRGATTDRDLYIVWQNSASVHGLRPDSTVIFKDFTIRSRYTLTNDKSVVKLLANSNLTMKNIHMAGINGGSGSAYPGINGYSGWTSLTLEGCALDSCQSTKGGSYAAVALYGTGKFVMDQTTVNACSSTRSPVAVIHSAAADSTRFSRSLFVDNSAGDYGGAIRTHLESGSSPCNIGYCEFVDNTSSDVDDGQVSFSTSERPTTIHHVGITGGGSTYALHKLAADRLTAVEYVNTWNTGQDHIFGAASYTDTIHVDPKFNSTTRPESGRYQARAAECARTADASYIGWEHWVRVSGSRHYGLRPRRYR